jgi:histidine phosphotransfer protein HptB
LIDAVVWQDLQDTVGAEFACELAGTFLEESPAMLKELERAHAAGDAEAFRRAAHSLKSNCLTFGALSLAQRARGFELAPVDSANAATLADLRTAYDESAVALKALARV